VRFLCLLVDRVATEVPRACPSARVFVRVLLCGMILLSSRPRSEARFQHAPVRAVRGAVGVAFVGPPPAAGGKWVPPTAARAQVVLPAGGPYVSAARPSVSSRCGMQRYPASSFSCVQAVAGGKRCRRRLALPRQLETSPREFAQPGFR